MPSAWTAEFEFHRDHLRVRKTGAVVPYSAAIAKEATDWLRLFAVLQARRVAGALTLRRRPRIAFVPDTPRPWYLVWAVAHAAGGRIIRDPRDADVVMYFEDVTQGLPPAVATPEEAGRINFACTDVSKSRVAEAFERVFQRPLAVDPRVWRGPAVEKSEHNGAHDGRIVTCPREPLPGRAYQRVVASSDGDGFVEDLRCPTVNGEIPVVFVKRRESARRFANANAEVQLREPDAVLTPAERAQLKQLAREMGLQWGGLDVLRDREDGQIYVVDVNKTDMGPPTAMPLSDQVEAVSRLGAAFRTAFFASDA